VPVVTVISPLLARLERTYDALPRVGGALVEYHGPLALFYRDGPGWPYYARPRLDAALDARLDAGGVTVTDILAVRARQRELHVPEALEWVHEVTPSMLASAEAAGLVVHHAPLMVLEPDRLPLLTAAAQVEFLDPDRPDFPEKLPISVAVAAVGFGNAGTASGAAGAAERDAALEPVDAARLATIADGIRHAGKAEAILTVPGDGVVARGGIQSALGVAEIVGVATLPAARRHGYGAAVSAALARRALDAGNDLVFLGAASDAVARVYASIGFTRVGTACIAEPRP
jgi:GNAT superfamily N-acetyltransferase